LSARIAHPLDARTNCPRSNKKPVIRYRSQLLYRRSYKPARILRARPGFVQLSYRPRRRCQPRFDRDLSFLVSF